MKILAGCALILLVLSLASCGAGDVAPSSQTFAGNWVFAFTSSKLGKGPTGTGPLTQSGVNVTGTLALTNSPCSSSAVFAGTLTGVSMNVTLTENGQAVMLVGQANYFLTTASGTYTSDVGGCLNGDTGTWTASKSAPAGMEKDRETHRE